MTFFLHTVHLTTGVEFPLADTGSFEGSDPNNIGAIDDSLWVAFNTRRFPSSVYFSLIQDIERLTGSLSRYLPDLYASLIIKEA